MSSGIRRLASRARALVRESRTVTVREGPAAGLELKLKHSSADYEAGTNELPVQHAIVHHLGPGAVFYDVGANIGFFSLLAARRVANTGAVHAFEAIPACARALRLNAARNGLHVAVHECAVSDAEGTIEVMQAKHPGGSSIAERPHDYVRSLEVRSTTLDAVVEGGAPAPTMVKIDVEGAELAVLAGASRLLTQRPPVVLCEVDDPSSSGAEHRAELVRAVLERVGYRVEMLERSYVRSRSTVLHLLGAPG